MDEFVCHTSDKIKLKRYSLLSASLQSLRGPNTSDVILHCGDTKFFAHRVVLESAGPYFVPLLKDAVDGANDNNVLHVVVKDMEADTLDAILNYLYVGEIKTVKLAHRMSKVMVAAHTMALEELSLYCCNSLQQLLSCENALEILEIYKQCEQQERFCKVLHYVILNTDDLSKTLQFLASSIEQIKCVVQFAKSKRWCLDGVFLAVLKWLQYNPAVREKFTDELLGSLDTNLITRDCINELLTTSTIQMHPGLKEKVEEIGLTVLLSGRNYSRDFPSPKFNTGTFMEKQKVIVFFSESQLHSLFNPETLQLKSTTTPRNCVQVFSIETMTWLPAKNTKIQLFDVMAMPSGQSSEEIILLIQHEYVELKLGNYNVKKNKTTMQDCYWFSFSKLKNFKTCSFDGAVYVVGSSDSKHTDLKSNVMFSNDDKGFKQWVAGEPLASAQTDFVLLASSDYLYVIGLIGESESDLLIQFNSKPVKDSKWETFHVPDCNLIGKDNFFVFQNVLHALYVDKNQAVLLSFDHAQGKLVEKRFGNVPKNFKCVERVCAFPTTVSNCQVYVSTALKNPIPNFAWEPQSGKWIELDKVKGKNELHEAGNLSSVNWIYAVT